MRHYRTIAIALITAFLAVPFNSMAEEEEFPVSFSPLVYDDFNENDVNGKINISIPEDSEAHVFITFDSPEVDGEEYYKMLITGGEVYSFDIEGRDKTEDDFRTYNLYVVFYDEKENSTKTIGYYSDTFSIPDGNDNPDSFTEYTYNITALDNEYNEKEWDEKVTGNTKDIIVHSNNINTIMFGDIDGNGVVDSADATAVLAEYSLMSTGEDGEFTPQQKAAADVNGDRIIDSNDASKILAYYSINSTGGDADWNDV